MSPRWRVPLILAVLVFCLSPGLAVAGQDLPTYVQVLLGAASFNRGNLTFAAPGSAGSGDAETVDLHQMPYLGLAFQVPLAGRQTEVGIEAGLLGGWRSRSTSVLLSNNQVRIRVKADFWLLDLSTGLFLRQPLGEQWVGYLAAGPAMLFGSYRGNSENLTLRSSPAAQQTQEAFGLGGYARAGLAYRLPANGFIGVCLRGLASNLKFPGVSSAEGLRGVQGFLTFSRLF